MLTSRRMAIAAGFLAFSALGAAQPARAQELVFLSTQLRPIEEAQKVRDILLKGAPKTSFIVDEPSAFAVRMQAEHDAGKHTISVVGALHGELQPLVPLGALDAVDDVAEAVKARGIPAKLMELGKFGGQNQLYIPWMQATYVLVVKKEAMPFLPAGADINALTYDQLAQWAKAIADKTGQRRLGFPAGPKGLFARFLQGYLYPSYTASSVTEFRSPEAEKMWTDFKALWASVNPNSTSYDFMQDPLQAGEVWIAWDHISRFKDALQASPGDYQVVPPPAGPKGRAYMPVIVGLGIVKGAPDRAGAAAVIAHLEKPETQIITAAETGFFPVVEAKLPADLSPGIKLLAEGVAKTQTAKDALAVLLPVGIGDKGGEFNKVFTDSFQRIVLRGEPVRATLDAEAAVMRDIIAATKAPCWAPDKPSNGPCPVN
ncbi:carbohydrate ABC transporter substrate-binding protein, CUT1 family [Rhizobiales bacterium GAS191]|nr:carbohydrate ABC transporter substrate-binding protein, CUT1 family [Rhizobiales bacterium GAS188]SEE58715.1 carbohydrate ABC transporter substrate-binding protein, CUT1 family [Rhizobiales bacterium GAS191]